MVDGQNGMRVLAHKQCILDAMELEAKKLGLVQPASYAAEIAEISAYGKQSFATFND